MEKAGDADVCSWTSGISVGARGRDYFGSLYRPVGGRSRFVHDISGNHQSDLSLYLNEHHALYHWFSAGSLPCSPDFYLQADVLNSIFVVLYALSGYFLYVRKVKTEKGPPLTNVLPNLLNLLKYTAPVYVAVLLNLIFGIPFYIGMLANLLIVFLLNPTKTYLSDAVRAININVLYSLIGVYLIQGIVGQLKSLTAFFTFIFSNSNTILLGIIGSSFFFGLTTGFQPTALGVVLPLLVTLPISDNRLLLYSHITFAWGFVSYFFSPLHLCQLFTCEYLNVSTKDLYKDYYKFFLCLVAILLSTYFVMGI